MELLCLDHDRGAVGVIGADHDYPVAAHSLVPDPDVGLDMLKDVPEMDGTVGVGKRAGYQHGSFFCHFLREFLITRRALMEGRVRRQLYRRCASHDGV